MAENEERAAFEKKARALFSTGSLASKVTLAAELQAMDAVNFFLTAVPWTITSELYPPINGHSETMRHALRDMQAYFLRLSKLCANDTVVSVSIDAGRLPAAGTPPKASGPA